MKTIYKLYIWNIEIFVYENLFTDSWVDVISVNFNSKKVYEDEIFGRQDKLQFFSRESKDYKCLRNILGVSGTLTLSLSFSDNSRIYIRDGKLVSDGKVSDENPSEYKSSDGNPSENID